MSASSVGVQRACLKFLTTTSTVAGRFYNRALAMPPEWSSDIVMGEFTALLNSNWWRKAAVTALMFASAAIAAGQTENILHVFQAGGDGYYPEIFPLVLDSAGSLYGTTSYGGAGNCTFQEVYTGCGMIYQLTPAAQSGGPWTENVIWQFQGGIDGAIPGGLLRRGGKLYGVAGTGGSVRQSSDGCAVFEEHVASANSYRCWQKDMVLETSLSPNQRNSYRTHCAA